MGDIFKKEQQSNHWDNLVVDVQSIYNKFPIGAVSQGATDNPTAAFFRRLYQTPLLPLLLRRYIRKIACQTNLDLGWFHDFSQYWSAVLGGRPFWGVEDFYFLTNLYRVRFQDNQVPDTNDASVHLTAWQRPEVLYQLLHLVYKETSVDYVTLIKQMFKYYPKMRTFLEFGCGTAPITASLFDFFGAKNGIKAYYSDIQTIAIHYATYRFARHKNAIPLMLVPENDFRLSLTGPVDAIACITVFEHLNKPLETARDFYSLLTPGGLLLFDYIKTDGEGMDTVQGARERETVLDFIAAHFELLQGDLSKTESTGLIIARKNNP